MVSEEEITLAILQGKNFEATVLTVSSHKPQTKQFDKSDVWLTVHRNSVWIRKTN